MTNFFILLNLIIYSFSKKKQVIILSVVEGLVKLEVRYYTNKQSAQKI